ncbi:MAG: tandem-95 repeat protein [Proteobacteria bacterium]|nr:tandem-95 repeat protein [Pseudomonadota bacterium]
MPPTVPGQPQDGTPSIETASQLPLTYVGADDRVSIGIDKDGNTQGELMGVFARNGKHAVVAQLWWNHGGAGGFQADYNWLFGMTPDEARANPDKATVAKFSFGMNQDEFKNRQAALGLAIERKQFFLNAYLATKASSSRDIGSISGTTQSEQDGTDDTGNFTQTFLTTTTTQLLSHPYNYSAGVHGGHFSDALGARFNAGADYDSGNQGVHETRASIGIDKYIGTRGWSVSGLAEHARQKDPLLGDHGDNRWWLTLRYEFGGSGAFVPTDKVGDTAWIMRALGNPVTTTPHTLRTYVSHGTITQHTVPGAKQYTAHRPVARNDSASVAANSSNNAIAVLANDSDADGNPISITAVTQPAHGTAQIAGSQIDYTPAPNYVGTDSFTYTISDNKGLSAMASVAIAIVANAPPVARDDDATTAFGTPIAINVLANDTDPNGYVLSVTAVTNPAHGTAQLAGNAVDYLPMPGFSGTDSFTYTVSDNHGGTATATVTVIVQPPGAPIAVNDSASTAYGTPVTIDVLANDSDPQGYPLGIVSVTNPAHGSAQISGNAIIYTPSASFNGGMDSFNYTVTDGHGNSASATVTVTVSAPGNPVARNDIATTAYKTPVTINVLANDTDPNNLALSISTVSTPANGSTQISGNSIVYTPAATFYGGVDSFSYVISDGHGGTASATVTVTVAPPPPPIAANYNATMQPIVGIAGFSASINVLANDSDPNGFPLTVVSVGAPTKGGYVTNNGNGNLTYAAPTPAPATDSFTYTISNGHGGTATGIVTVQLPTFQITTAVTPNGTGAISPASMTVTYGTIAHFTLTPSTGFLIDSTTTNADAALPGACGGSLSGSMFTTPPITKSCTVTAAFYYPIQ